MSRLTPEHQALWSSSPGAEEERFPPLTHRADYGIRPSSWLLPGLIAVGLGVLAWYYLGRDLRRYMKIRNM
jgi:hypothetical protein